MSNIATIIVDILGYAKVILPLLGKLVPDLAAKINKLRQLVEQAGVEGAQLINDNLDEINAAESAFAAGADVCSAGKLTCALLKKYAADGKLTTDELASLARAAALVDDNKVKLLATKLAGGASAA